MKQEKGKRKMLKYEIIKPAMVRCHDSKTDSEGKPKI